MTNPLTQYYRAPKLYVKLPSEGRFYMDDLITYSPSDEVAVYSLTAIDQILLKTPDAVLNGESMLKVFRGCVPDVKDPKRLVEPDILTLMIAIRVATSGEMMEINVSCPNCQTEHSFDVNIKHILDTQTTLNDDSTITLDDHLMIHLRPYDFQQRNMQLLNEIQEAQAIGLLQATNAVGDPDTMAQLADQIDKMADRTFNVLARSIISVTILKTGETVTDPEYLTEFLKGITKVQADSIIDKIRELNKSGIDANLHFTCTNCSHEWDQTLDFDPTSFFG